MEKEIQIIAELASNLASIETDTNMENLKSETIQHNNNEIKKIINTQYEAVQEEKRRTKEIADKHLTLLKNNINIIKAHLGIKRAIEVKIDLLLKKGIRFEVFENRQQLPDSNLFMATYGMYAILWKSVNKVILTYQTELLWIQ